MRVLIVEDDEVLADGLKAGLSIAGLSAEIAEDCEAGRAALAVGGFDAVVLDIMLPDGSGLDLLSERRRQGDATPVILLTARDATEDKVQGLDLGADDYLAKPFDLDELLARLRAVRRRASGRATPAIQWHDLTLDVASRRATKGGDALHLSRREFAILAALLERPGAIFSRAQLEERLYGWEEEVESNAVEVHIHHLRTKLGPGVIQTVRGLGYRLADRA